MKLSFKNIITLLTLFCVAFISAQQNSLYNTYSLDLLQLNMAYAGAGCTEANLHYRTQWLGLKDAPKVFQVNAHTPLGKSHGLGLRMDSQSYGILNILGATIGYSYKVKLNETNKLHFGVGAGFSQATLNGAKATVIDMSDVTLNNNNKQTANGFDSEFGAMFIGSKLKAGLSVLHLYNSNPSFAGTNSFKTLPQVNSQVSYVFNKDSKFEIEPWLLNRYTIKGNNIIEAMVNIKYNKTLLLGAGYRSNYGMMVLLGAKIGNIKLGYSFDYGANKNATNLGSSHQIMLGFTMCRAAKPELTAEEPTVAIQTTVSPIEAVDSEQKKSEEIKKEELVIKEEPKKEEPAKEEPRKEGVVVKEESAEQKVIKQAPKTDVIEAQDALARINRIAEGVIFEFNKSKLDAINHTKLDEIASIVNDSPELKINIIGHTCSIGSKEANGFLSVSRATYVRDELVKRGVNPKRLKRSIGAGSERNLYNNTDPVEQLKNRTIRFERAQ